MKTYKKTKNTKFTKKYNKKKGGDNDENEKIPNTLRIKPTIETTSTIPETTAVKLTVRNKPNSTGRRRNRNRVLSNIFSKILPFQKRKTRIAIDEKDEKDEKGVETDLTESSEIYYNPLIKYRAGRKPNKQKTKKQKKQNN